jgi:hypothetical protein
MIGQSPIFDEARGWVVAAAAAVGFDQSLPLVAQALPGVNDAFLMQLAEKGGGWVVLLIVLFFYRRDYQRLTTSENEVRKELLTAAGRQAESEKLLAVALEKNSEMIRQLLANQNGEFYGDERRHDDRRRT